MPNFKKKPITIEAKQFNGTIESGKEIIKWSDEAVWYLEDSVIDNGKLCIMTLEGVMTASVGDWIIKGVHDEFYPCKPDIFAKTYEMISDEYPSNNKQLYMMGRENATIDITNQINKWDGETETALGKLLNEKFNDIFKMKFQAWD